MTYLFDKAFQITLMLIFLLIFLLFMIIGIVVLGRMKRKNKKEFIITHLFFNKHNIHIHIHIHFPYSFPSMIYHRILNVVLCAIQ